MRKVVCSVATIPLSHGLDLIQFVDLPRRCRKLACVGHLSINIEVAIILVVLLKFKLEGSRSFLLFFMLDTNRSAILAISVFRWKYGMLDHLIDQART